MIPCAQGTLAACGRARAPWANRRGAGRGRDKQFLGISGHTPVCQGAQFPTILLQLPRCDSKWLELEICFSVNFVLVTRGLFFMADMLMSLDDHDSIEEQCNDHL